MSNIYKSHVLVAKFIMRRFAFNNNGNGLFVSRLCLNDLKIINDPIKTLDTIENYYTEKAELFLAKEIEMKMGETLKKIRNKLLKNKNDIKLNKDDALNIKRFFKYSLIRNREFINEVIDGSEMLNEVNGLNHSYFILNSGNIDFQLDNSSIYILINKSNSNFVCPHNLIYFVYIDNLNTIIPCITFDKKIVLGLCLNGKHNLISCSIFKDKTIVENINYFAYIMENSRKESYIIGDKEDLEYIIMQEYKEEDFLKYGLNIQKKQSI